MPQQKVFDDDPTVPDETVIYYSRAKLIFQVSIFVFLLGLMTFAIIRAGSEAPAVYLLGLLILPLLLFIIYLRAKELRNTSPQIILNASGIQIEDQPLASWKNINDEQIVKVVSGKSATTYLQFNKSSGEQVRKDIDDLAISRKKLAKLLSVYRARYEAKQSPQQNKVLPAE